MQKNLKQCILGCPLLVNHKEKVRFVLVGGINAVVDFVIYGLLANVLGLVVVAASMISTAITVLGVSFGLNYKFVWKSKKSKRETAPRFVAVSLFSAWVVQSGIIWLITSLFGSDDVTNLVAKVVGICVGTIFNFLGYRYIFR